MAVNNEWPIGQPPEFATGAVAVGGHEEILIEIGVVDTTAEVGVDQAGQPALPIQLDIGAIEFGEVGQLEHLGCTVARIGAQPVGPPLDQSLGGKAHVVHQHLIRHHRNG